MAATGLTESLIEDEIGCGPFQGLIVTFLFVLIKVPSLANMIFMAYGNYNPGWRCLDNVTTTFNDPFNHTHHNLSSWNHRKGEGEEGGEEIPYRLELKCSEYEACHRIQFNPESSTVVTEWNLVCDRAWIASLIVSLQMAGTCTGSMVSGYIADAFGRKKTFYISLFVVAVLDFTSTFSTRWEIFAAFRFVIGGVCNFFDSLNYLYPAEFLTRRWRGPVTGIPGWSVAGLLFAVECLLLKDWRHVLIATSVTTFIGFLPVVWVPESLRWLEVKDKREEFKRVAEKMARLNKKELPSDLFRLRDGDNDHEKTCSDSPTTNTRQIDTKRYTFLDLFRPGYRLITVYVGLSWMLMSFIYNAIGFGIKALSGDFYLNIILIYAALFPAAVFPFFGPNLLGRTKCTSIFIFFTGISLLTATVFELYTEGDVRTFGTLVMVMIAEVGADTTFCVTQVHVGEIYPTVVRGLGMNLAFVMARIGGILSPFVIPMDSESVYLWYLVTGCLSIVCCGLFSRLPETWGKPLKETFDRTLEFEFEVEKSNGNIGGMAEEEGQKFIESEGKTDLQSTDTTTTQDKQNFV